MSRCGDSSRIQDQQMNAHSGFFCYFYRDSEKLDLSGWVIQGVAHPEFFVIFYSVDSISYLIVYRSPGFCSDAEPGLLFL